MTAGNKVRGKAIAAAVAVVAIGVVGVAVARQPQRDASASRGALKTGMSLPEAIGALKGSYACRTNDVGAAQPGRAQVFLGRGAGTYQVAIDDGRAAVTQASPPDEKQYLGMVEKQAPAIAPKLRLVCSFRGVASTAHVTLTFGGDGALASIEGD